MPPIISSTNLSSEKTFQRLLISTEKHLEDKTIEDWKVNQVKIRIQLILLLLYIYLFFR